MLRRRLLSLLLALLIPLSASASGTWYTLSGKDSPEALSEGGSSFSGEITMTFLGDCTLGGEEKNRRSPLGFFRTVEEKGFSYPLEGLSALTLADDLTVANLEVVLSDRKLSRADKQFNFIGPTAYTEILTSAGAECVTLANNHTHDYGDKGYADTKAALEAAGVCWFGTDAPAVWRSDEGVLIGFLGVSYSLTGTRYKQFARQAERLKDLGCAAVITVMHAGTEYSATPPDNYQKQIVSRAIQCGTHLIIGHHPHVVQGYDVVEGVPVVYSLGNCSFGGAIYPKVTDALVTRAVLTFEEGVLREIALHFYPISITSTPGANDFAPCLLKGEDALRVLERMRQTTGQDPGEWDEAEGAVARVKTGE
ncbi:MAG: CapA family protein [Clostridia bacterium]|nr:CapA family protein [Clostridia bacterium]